MSRRRTAPLATAVATSTTNTPRGSYLVRVLEQRAVTVRLVYELRDLASGESLQFPSSRAMQRWLSARH